MVQSSPEPTRHIVFQYLVPVHVEVEDGLIARVTVIDETPVRDPTVVEGDPEYLNRPSRPPMTASPGRPGGSATSPPTTNPTQPSPAPAPGSFRFRSPTCPPISPAFPACSTLARSST